MVWSYNSTHSDMSVVDQGLWCGLITLPIQTCEMWIKDLHLREHGVKNYHDYEVEEIFLIFAS
jgi:hypothetical protein